MIVNIAIGFEVKLIEFKYYFYFLIPVGPWILITLGLSFLIYKVKIEMLTLHKITVKIQ